MSLNPLNIDMERALSSLVDKNALQQVQSLRKMTEWTGQVFEFQLANLKLWPLVLFKHIATNEVRIDTDSKEITFIFQPKPKARKPSDLKNNLAILDYSVRKLLGRDWLIKVRIGNVQVHRGEKYDRAISDSSIAAN